MRHAEEFADLCSVHKPRARKAHKCDETIDVGQTYTRYGIVHDGTAGTVKHCNRCRAIFLAQDPREPIDMSLDCGETWADVFGPCPEEVQALAFMLLGEALP